MLTSAFMMTALVPHAALAGTTGTIAGVVTDVATGAPIANVHVTAASSSQTESTTTNSAGFYSLQALTPDTYTVSFQGTGYTPTNQPGITVQQDFVYKLDTKLTKELRTIAQVHSRAAGNLVKPYEGTDVYNVSGEQLKAATGGDNLHKTVYEYLNTVPGVAPIGGGFPAEPSIRGGYDVDNGYELDGIPITERMTGYFTTNLTDLGIGNVEVFTGGLSAQNAGNGVGIINSVIKTGSYPAQGSLNVGLTSPQFNHFFRAEYGGATPDRRFSYYLAFDSANSQNDFNDGTVSFTLPQVGISSGNPGYIYTRDAIANFHYRPNQRDDIQFLYQNSLFDGKIDYMLYSGTDSAPLLGLAPCPGAVPDNSNRTGAHGGTAPNGQTCPGGLYFTALKNGAGNFIGHYSGIGKIQWNHVIDSHSSFALRLAENFNQYIFDQPLTDPNLAEFGSPRSGCPAYPYTAGSPLPLTSSGRECTMDLGDYYQNRYGNQYYAQLDYTSTPNENLTIKAGAGQEYDNQLRDVRYLNWFNNPNNPYAPCGGSTFSFSCMNSLTDIPVHAPYVYAQASMNLGKWTVQPGLRYSTASYAIPAQPTVNTATQPNGVPGGTSRVSFLAPSLLGTYRFGFNDVMRWSYSTTGQFIGTEFVFRRGSCTYNPYCVNPTTGLTPSNKPQVNTSFDLQWEHQINPNTSLKVGPYYRFSNNYLASYSPLIAENPAPKYGPPELANNLKIRSFGVELGLSHVEPGPVGNSFWLSASLNNYWTQISSFGQVAFINFPIADYFLQHGQFVRSPLSAPFAATFVADIHKNGLHFIPDLYYTFGNFYNVGGCIPYSKTTGQPIPWNQYQQPVGCTSSVATNGGTALPVMAPESQGMAYWKANATILKDLNEHYSIGVRIVNLTDNEHDWDGATIPCYNNQDPNAPPGVGTGCFSNNGPHSGVYAPVGYIYQNQTQNPRSFEFFLNYHF
jgi:hypothetical protein